VKEKLIENLSLYCSLNLNQWIIINYLVTYFALILSEVQLKKEKFLHCKLKY